jgi:membrane protease YdiL (CAAX protease family)
MKSLIKGQQLVIALLKCAFVAGAVMGLTVYIGSFLGLSLWRSLAQVGITLAVVLLTGRILNHDIGLSKLRSKVPLESATAFLFLLGGVSIFCNLLAEVEQYIRMGFAEYSNLFNYSMGAGSGDILRTLVFGPISEEILFRAFLFFLLRKTFSPMTSNVGISVVFAVFHFNSGHASPIAVVLSSFLISLLLGTAMERTRNLIFVVLLHMLDNLSWFVYALLLVMLGVKLSQVVHFYIMSGTVIIISLLLVLAGMIKYNSLSKRLIG